MTKVVSKRPQQRVSSAMVQKANKCLRVARLMLGTAATTQDLESQAVSLMDMEASQLDATVARLQSKVSASKKADEEAEVEGEEVIDLTEVPTEQLEMELARREAEAAAAGEEAMPMVEEAAQELPADLDVEASLETDPNEVDVVAVRACAKRLAMGLKALKVTPAVAELYKAVASIYNDLAPEKVASANAVSVAKKAYKVAKTLKGLKNPTRQAKRLSRIAGELAEGILVSDDSGKPDQSNEENEAYKPGTEMAESLVQKAVAADTKKEARLRRAEKEGEGLLEELKDVTKELEGLPETSDEDVVSGSEKDADSGLPGSHSDGDGSISEESELREEVGMVASEEDVLDMLFEQDEKVASQKLAALSTRTASKQGVKRIGPGRRTASNSGKTEMGQLESQIWSTKPDVSSYFQ